MTLVVAGPASSTTSTLSAEMSVYYDKVFLDRLVMEQVYNFLATKKALPKNAGKTISFTRQTAFTPKTTALTEGTNPTGTPFSSASVTATVAEYGDFDTISSLFEMTSIDAGLKEKADAMGQYAGESIDTVLRNTMFSGATAQYVGAGGLTGVGSTDVMTVAALRTAVLALKVAKAPKFDAPVGKVAGGAYRAVVDSYGYDDLMGDSAVGNFTTTNIYASNEGVTQVKNMEIKRLAGCDVVESNNVLSVATLGASSTDTGYVSFVAGKGAVGEVDIAGSMNSYLIIEPSTSGGVSNPLHMFGTVGWKVDGYAAVVLNSDWLRAIYHR